MIECTVCGSSSNIDLDRRDFVPVAQNLIFQSPEKARACPAGSLDMKRCTGCGFVWNAAFDPTLMVYDAAYDNDQNFSARFQQHTSEIAGRIGARIAGAGPVDLVEVGCGQGTFLEVLGRQFGSRLASAIGFDPAWQGDTRHLPPGGEVRSTYFDKSSIRKDDPRPSLVVSRHVIEHVPDPLAFLRAIRVGVQEGTPLFIETPDIDWVLQGGVFFDFYYEHCSLFSQFSLALALERAGFIVEEIRPVFDKQYQLAVATAGPAGWTRGEDIVPGVFDDLGFRSKRATYLNALAAAIDNAGPRGSVALWGGASKGVTICLTLPGAEERLPCVIDINARKQGCYLPTSATPILSPREAVATGIRHAIVTNPAYLEEICRGIAEDGLDLAVSSIDDAVSW